MRRHSWWRTPVTSVRVSCGCWVVGCWTWLRRMWPRVTRSDCCSPRRSGVVARRGLSFRPRGDGVTDVIARLPDQVADRLRIYLDAFTAPRRRRLGSADSDVDLLPLPRRRGVAFRALLEQVPVEGLPTHGGTPTSVVVMLDCESLRSGARCGRLSTGGRMSATEVRRLRVHREHPPGRPRWCRRGARPRPHPAAVLHRPAQGDGRPRPALSRRGLRHPCRVVRGPPRRLRPGRAEVAPTSPTGCPALLVPPPPRSRSAVAQRPTAQR